jgi:hypothetical protein
MYDMGNRLIGIDSSRKDRPILGERSIQLVHYSIDFGIGVLSEMDLGHSWPDQDDSIIKCV